LVPPNSVLASKLNPQFPRVWLPDVQDSNSSICSTEFMPLVPVVESWRPYLYEMLKSQTIQSEIISRVTGSTGSRQRIKPKEIAVLPCLVPPKTLIDFFCSQVGPWYENLLLNIRQSAILSSLRDTLLPKLISGELRIPDAEKFIEEAGV
jgi:type I restriction enzyme S subunit